MKHSVLTPWLYEQKGGIQDLVPGVLVLAHWYLVVATDVGGNAICFQVPSGRVVWIEHTMSGILLHTRTGRATIIVL